MLKQRLITAAILIPLVVWALLGLSTEVLGYALGFVALLAAWEWLQLTGFKHKTQLSLLTAAMLATSVIVFVTVSTNVILAMTVLLWLLATVLIIVYAHKTLPASLEMIFKKPLFGLLTATLVLLGFVTAASFIHAIPEQGPALLLFVLVSVWLADTGGYFAGKRFGKHKLASAISPNKTWEGVLGALVLSGIFAILFYVTVLDTHLSLVSWLLLTVFIVMISIVGDLFESVFKRCFNVKDSGNLLPGHGGMLDRIDSLLAATPVFAAVLMATGVY